MMFQTDIQVNCLANSGCCSATSKDHEIWHHLLVKQGSSQQQVQHKKEEFYLDKTAGRISVGNVALKTGSEQN